MATKHKLLLAIMNYWNVLYVLFGMGTVWNLYLNNNPAYVLITFVAGYLYLVPPLLCRLAFIIYGRPTARDRFGSKGFFVWWATLQLQIIFLRFPALEEALRLIPGLYSLWLRLWGAKIGKMVFWGAKLSILDRPFLEIGDNVVVGYGAGFSSHTMYRQSEKRMRFLVKPIEVKSGAVVGAETGLPPGCKLEKNAVLPYKKVLKPYQVWTREKPDNSIQEEHYISQSRPNTRKKKLLNHKTERELQEKTGYDWEASFYKNSRPEL